MTTLKKNMHETHKAEGAKKYRNTNGILFFIKSKYLSTTKKIIPFRSQIICIYISVYMHALLKSYPSPPTAHLKPYKERTPTQDP